MSWKLSRAVGSPDGADGDERQRASKRAKALRWCRRASAFREGAVCCRAVSQSWRCAALATFAATLFAASGACLLTSDLDRLDREGPGSEGGGSSGCPADMVAASLSDGGAFCIDRYEATVDQYRAFLAGADASTQGPRCAWNDSFSPSRSGQCTAYDFTSVQGKTPITCIDWCDAAAYCGASGKRLCGNLARPGETTQLDDANLEIELSTSEWVFACGGAAPRRAFPYGDIFDAARCIDKGAGPTQRSSTCEGSIPGLFDMSGNVSEWDDTCLPTGDPANDPCRGRGGAFWCANSGVPEDQNLLRCDRPQSGERSAAYTDRGVRCCKTP